MEWQSRCALHRSAQHNNHSEPDGSAQNWLGYLRVGSISPGEDHSAMNFRIALKADAGSVNFAH